MSLTPGQQLRAYVDYLRDMGVYDLYRKDAPELVLSEAMLATLKSEAGKALGAEVARPVVKTPVAAPAAATLSPFAKAQEHAQPAPRPPVRPPVPAPAATVATTSTDFTFDPPFDALMPKPLSFDQLAAPPASAIPAAQKAAALLAIRADIGDCTRCPLAYAGRHNIVYGDGDANAKLMFVGEGPGADEDVTGVPFVGKAGQLLNNMIAAMGVTREQVYIANIVKCRPPQNRAPEPIEANTCSQFLLRQIDVVQPKVIVALGATAATYLLGVKQSLASLRGEWHAARGAKVAVTYHPAFLLRDPRQKGEAWKDLQRVMVELGLQAPKK